MKTVQIFVNKWIRKENSPNYTSIVTKAAQYQDDGQDNEEICDHAFRIFNAPEEILDKNEKEILGSYHRNFPSLSVGDFVQITDKNGVSENFECAGAGWTKIDEIPVGHEKELL